MAEMPAQAMCSTKYYAAAWLSTLPQWGLDLLPSFVCVRTEVRVHKDLPLIGHYSDWSSVSRLSWTRGILRLEHACFLSLIDLAADSHP